MRQSVPNKRMRTRSRKGPNPLQRTYESNGPDVKIRGTAMHIAEKYVALARDAHAAGDPVLSENYLQHAEHYYRIVAAAQAQMPQPIQVIRSDIQDEDEFEDEASPAEMRMPAAPLGDAQQPYVEDMAFERPRPQNGGGEGRGYPDVRGYPDPRGPNESRFYPEPRGGQEARFYGEGRGPGQPRGYPEARGPHRGYPDPRNQSQQSQPRPYAERGEPPRYPATERQPPAEARPGFEAPNLPAEGGEGTTGLPAFVTGGVSPEDPVSGGYRRRRRGGRGRSRPDYAPPREEGVGGAAAAAEGVPGNGAAGDFESEAPVGGE